MSTQLGIFISYSRHNSAFVDHLEADLQAQGYYTWVDRRKIEGGQRWLEELQLAIDRSQIFLLCISPESMASKYVQDEYQYATQENKRIIPVLIQPAKVWLGLHSIQHIDFRVYQQGIQQLLYALHNPSGNLTAYHAPKLRTNSGSFVSSSLKSVFLSVLMFFTATLFGFNPDRSLPILCLIWGGLFLVNSALLGVFGFFRRIF